MPTPAHGHLRLVTDDPARAVPGAAQRGPGDPAGEPVGEQQRTRSGGGTRAPACTGAAACLAVLLVLLGGQRWELPTRSAGGVSAVPQSLLTFLLVCGAVCTWAAGRVTRPAAVLRSAGAVGVWWAVTAAAGLVAVAADVPLASYAVVGWPGGLVARWAVPFVPAVLAGLLGSGREARIRLALGTGVVTLPLVAVGWALLGSPATSPVGPPDVVAMTLLVGVSPVAFAVAVLTARRRRA